MYCVIVYVMYEYNIYSTEQERLKGFIGSVER